VLADVGIDTRGRFSSGRKGFEQREDAVSHTDRQIGLGIEAGRPTVVRRRVSSTSECAVSIIRSL